ncbi:COMM domain-containing protein 8-like [Dreissena polymorpha]|uniref:COMM domain-containing protein n=1 Tax=Dreissena polymorpha TaxID=45954 RepID=A0A9D4KNN5_DREPO|nr:COMM domain-containing protein 8-like [Dreissena polymorpha]KAH3843248.1 hypothetical protein DPMN_116759 [Dreissena polymorpha]
MAKENKRTILSHEEVELLMKLDANVCSNYLHRLIDGVCHRGKPSYEEYKKWWNLHEWWCVGDAFTGLYKHAVKHSWGKEQFLEQVSSLTAEYQTAACDVLVSREKEVRSQLLMDSHAISHASMTDFDWKLKLVLSSDKISSVQEPLLSLDMIIQTNDGQKTVAVELNKGQLAHLISTLEAANKAIIQLKS